MRDTYGFGTDDPDVVFMRLLCVESHICEKIVNCCRNGQRTSEVTLTDEETDADAGHVEAVKP